MEASSSCGTTFSSSIQVDFKNIDLDLGPDTLFCIENELILDATHPNASTYNWSNGETTPSIIISEEGQYSVELSNECETVLKEINTIEKSCEECKVYVPNAISRNALGVNDQLLIQANCKLETYHLRIYNRWGSMLFETTDQFDTWNGTMAGGSNGSVGVYAYQLHYSYVNNSELIAKKIQGDILLID